MFGPRWTKVFRDCFGNMGRSLLVVLSIAVGVAAVGIVLGAHENLSKNLSASYAQINPAAASITAEPFDEDLVRVVRTIPGVAAAEGRYTLTVRVRQGEDDWRSLKLTVVPDYLHIQINKIYPESEAWPPPDRSLIIERASLPLLGNQVGGTLLVQTPEGKQREMKIAGLAHDLSEPAGTFTDQASGFITFDTLKWLGYTRSYNEMLILTKLDRPDRAYYQQVANLVANKMEKSGRLVYWTTVQDPNQHWFEPLLTPMTSILGTLGVLSLILSCFLVINTVNALLSQQVRQIGIMKTIGASRLQLVGMFLTLIGLFGVFALVLAVPLGVLGARLSVHLLAGYINFDPPEYQIGPSIFLLQMALGLLIPLVAALFPVISGTRISIREALAYTGLGQTYFRSDWIDRIVGRIQTLPRPMLLSLRNTFRKKARLGLTLVSLTLGSAVFIAVVTVQSSLIKTLDETLQYYKFDILVSFERPYRKEMVLAESRKIPAVTAAETWGVANSHRILPDASESDNILLVAPPTGTEMIQPSLIQGRWLIPEDENAVVINTDVLRENPDLKVGSELVLKVEGVKTRWKVVGIVQSVLIGPWIYTNYPYFAYRLNKANLSSAVYLVTQLHDPASLKFISRQIEQHFDQAGLRINSTARVSDLRQAAILQFNVLILFLLMMAILIAIVGCLGLSGTMGLNVVERTREIGVMRSIGATNKSIFGIFIFEGAFIGLLSWALGALAAWPLGSFLCDLIGTSFLQGPLIARYSFMGAAAWLGIVLVLSALASFLPALNAARLSVRAVLAYE